jgi:hypothetical protein
VQADFGNRDTGILLEDKKMRKSVLAGFRMQLRCLKDRARLLDGIAPEQTARTTLRGVFIETALRLRVLRLSNRPLPGSAAGGPPSPRATRAKAVGSYLNSRNLRPVHAAGGVVSFRK